jgi:hypothetical protein
MRQIHRAASLFQDIFEHFLALTFPSGSYLREITEDGGLIVVKYGCPSPSQQSHGPGPASGLTRFPLELAPSSDAARGALMHGRCWEATSRARALFEMLIRRKYTFSFPQPPRQPLTRPGISQLFPRRSKTL